LASAFVLLIQENKAGAKAMQHLRNTMVLGNLRLQQDSTGGMTVWAALSLRIFEE
jgi:hypothetical protein